MMLLRVYKYCYFRFMRLLLLVFLVLSFMNVNAQSRQDAVSILKILDERLGRELHYGSFYNSLYEARNVRAVRKTIIIPGSFTISDSSNYSKGLIHSNFKMITKAPHINDTVRTPTFYFYEGQKIVKVEGYTDTTVYGFSDSVLIQKEHISSCRNYTEFLVYDDSLRLRYILAEYGGKKDTAWVILYERPILRGKHGIGLQITMQPGKLKGRSHEWCRIIFDENYNKVKVLEGTELDGCELSFSYWHSNERYKTASVITSCNSGDKVDKYNEVQEYEYNGNDLMLIRTKFQDQSQQRCEWFQNQLPVKSCACDQDPDDKSSGLYYQYYYE